MIIVFSMTLRRTWWFHDTGDGDTSLVYTFRCTGYDVFDLTKRLNDINIQITSIWIRMYSSVFPFVNHLTVQHSGGSSHSPGNRLTFQLTRNSDTCSTITMQPSAIYINIVRYDVAKRIVSRDTIRYRAYVSIVWELLTVGQEASSMFSENNRRSADS
jgi:hypothetical protein